MGRMGIRKAALVALFASLVMSGPAFGQVNPHAEPSTLDGVDLTEVTIEDARLDAALETYLADEDLQTERPEWEPEFIQREHREPNGFIKAIAAFLNAIGPVVGYLLLFLVVAAILAGLYFIFGESLSLRGRQKAVRSEPDVSEVPNLRPTEAAATALLEDADALAAAGRFAEAVHLLLFRSIDDIQERQQGGVARSLTAREIGRLDSLPGRVRDALSPIIRLVERSFFGDHTVDETGWKTARASYQDFAFGGVWT